MTLSLKTIAIGFLTLTTTYILFMIYLLNKSYSNQNNVLFNDNKPYILSLKSIKDINKNDLSSNNYILNSNVVSNIVSSLILNGNNYCLELVGLRFNNTEGYLADKKFEILKDKNNNEIIIPNSDTSITLDFNKYNITPGQYYFFLKDYNISNYNIEQANGTENQKFVMTCIVDILIS